MLKQEKTKTATVDTNKEEHVKYCFAAALRLDSPSRDQNTDSATSIGFTQCHTKFFIAFTSYTE